MKKLLSVAMVIMASLAVGVSEVKADELDFSLPTVAPTKTPTSPGKISYAGGVNPLVGSNISVVSVIGVGTPSNDGSSLTITNGLLNFTTGNLNGSDATNWFFGGGGSISLTGNIPALGLTNATLFQGSFTNAQVSVIGSELRIAIAIFTDRKDPALVDYFGLWNSPYAGTMEIVFNLFSKIPPPPSKFSSHNILSGTITNTPVPEPSTLSLLGLGLLGMAGVARRRFLA